MEAEAALIAITYGYSRNASGGTHRSGCMRLPTPMMGMSRCSCSRSVARALTNSARVAAVTVLQEQLRELKYATDEHVGGEVSEPGMGVLHRGENGAISKQIGAGMATFRGWQHPVVSSGHGLTVGKRTALVIVRTSASHQRAHTSLQRQVRRDTGCRHTWPKESRPFSTRRTNPQHA